MSAEANKAILLHAIDELNKGNLDFIDEVFSPNFAFHSSFNPDGPLRGLEGARTMIMRSRTVFPDLHATVEDIFAEGDKVAVRWTFRGTYQGEVRPGFPNPGERCVLTSMSMYRVVDGKIEEDWGVDTFWRVGNPWE
jgi:steroid delta-isomerase-like uncharacterized protein